MTKKTTKETAPMTETKAAPEGFSRDTAVQDAPWVNFEAGNLVHGRLLGCFTIQTSPPRDYYQVELVAPCTVRVGKGSDQEIVQAQPGDVVNLGITYNLRCYQEKQIPEIDAGAVWSVWILIGKKEKRGNGHTFWHVDPRSKREKGPTGPVVPKASTAPAAGDDDDATVPF